jgi:peptidoglycan/xylan/chitin deacetylase (PgdA/CDA1 family)
MTNRVLEILVRTVRNASDASWTARLAVAMGRVVGTRGAVLCFHGLDVDGAPSRASMHVPLRLLEASVSVIRSLATIVPLREIVSRHVAGRGTAGLVALTADDAYASLLAAEPFLQRSGVPLTVFVVSAALAGGRTFWWDRIDDLFPLASPEQWRRFENECGLPETYRCGQPVDEGPLRPLRQWLLAEHAGRWPDALEEPLFRLEEDLGRRTAQRSMTEAELEGFVARTGIEVGIHTVSHAVLPFLPDDELVREIAHCHNELRARFPEVVPYLAVPFGLADQRTLRLAAEAGVTVSLTLTGVPLRPRFIPELGVPRFCVVRECTPGILALQLSGVAALVNRLRGRRFTPYPALPSPTT